MATAVSIGTLYCYEESSLEIRFEDAIFLGSGKDIDEIKKLSSTGVVEKDGRQPRTPPDGVTAALSVLDYEYETFGVREE